MRKCEGSALLSWSVFITQLCCSDSPDSVSSLSLLMWSNIVNQRTGCRSDRHQHPHSTFHCHHHFIQMQQVKYEGNDMFAQTRPTVRPCVLVIVDLVSRSVATATHLTWWGMCESVCVCVCVCSSALTYHVFLCWFYTYCGDVRLFAQLLNFKMCFEQENTVWRCTCVLFIFYCNLS